MSQRLSARPILDQTVLNTPYGGELRELLLAPADVPAATLRAAGLPVEFITPSEYERV